VSSVWCPWLDVGAIVAIGFGHLVLDLLPDAKEHTEHVSFIWHNLLQLGCEKLAIPYVNDISLLELSERVLLHQAFDWAFHKVTPLSRELILIYKNSDDLVGYFRHCNGVRGHIALD
jgi:hypothetical protein